MKAKPSLYYDHHVKLPNRNAGLYSRSTIVNVNTSFPSSNFEWNFTTYVFGKSFWHYRELKIYCWTSRHILCKKNIKYFRMCGGENSCRKVKCIRRSHFPQAITTNMQTGNDLLMFKKPVTCKKKFPISHYFIEINGNVCLLCAHHVMTNVFLQTRRCNCQ